MNNQEEYKRKHSALISYKNNPAITLKDRRKTDISRDKDDKKLHLPTDRANSKMLPQQDENTKVNPKVINFRLLKDTLPKKEPPQRKNTIKNNADYFQKNIRPSQSPNQTGIAINVNIQNMMAPRIPNLATTETFEQPQLPKSDRSQLPDQKNEKKCKKIPLINPLKKFDDFQCNEELNFKKSGMEAKPKPQQKTVEKNPVVDRIERKNNRLELHTKVKVDPKDVLKKFETELQNINCNNQAQTFSYLDCRQSHYLVPPDYIEKCQKNFNWIMRSTLLEWIMHVSYQFCMKRQTFYLAVNLVDLFMTREFNLPKSEFQLAGAAAMFIASKLEEFEPKSSEDFSLATAKYDAAKIKEMERKICKALKYQLNPPTLYMWANRIMLQWDTYLEMNCYAQRHPLFSTCQPKYFKKNDDDSYRTYRVMMQLLDCATLQIQTVQYKPKLLVCAFMYLVLGKEMGIFKTKQITNQFPRKSLYLMDEQNLFNDLFLSFLQQSFNIALIDLLPAVQYSATFFILPLTYDDPIMPPSYEEPDHEMNYQQFCSFQTHNPHLLAVIKKRFRGIYE